MVSNHSEGTFERLRYPFGLYVNDFEKEDLKYYFPEFTPFEGQCKFNGCDHIHEPGCAVKEAVEEGKIHKIRYEDYTEMYRELKERKRY